MIAHSGGKNPYDPPHHDSSQNAGARRWQLVRFLAIIALLAILVYSVTTIGYGIYRFGEINSFSRLRVVMIESLDLGTGLMLVIIGAAFMRKLLSFSLVQSTIVSGVSMAGAIAVASVIAAVFQLTPRTYADDSGTVFRPVCALLLFVIFIWVASLVFRKRLKEADVTEYNRNWDEQF